MKCRLLHFLFGALIVKLVLHAQNIAAYSFVMDNKVWTSNPKVCKYKLLLSNRFDIVEPNVSHISENLHANHSALATLLSIYIPSVGATSVFLAKISP